jgi:propionyl-CoA carboxylase beta chain
LSSAHTSPSAPDIHTTADKLAVLRERLAEADVPSDEAAAEKVYAKGKLTARERITALLDEGWFVELDGVVSDYGTVAGRDGCVFSQDATVFGEIYGEKIVKIMDLVFKTGRPLVGINEGRAGAHIQEGVVSLGLYGKIFHRNVRMAGVVPQISLIMGPTAGGHVTPRPGPTSGSWPIRPRRCSSPDPT